MDKLRLSFKVNLQFFAGEKTEPATSKKRRDVRKKGQVFKSQDLVVAVSILVAFTILPKYLELIRGYALNFMASSLVVEKVDQFTFEGLSNLFFKCVIAVILFAVPLMLAILLLGVAINLLQTGLLNVPDLLKPKFERINPLQGFKRMFSKRALANLVKSLLKVLVIGYIAYSALVANVSRVLSLGQVSLGDAFYLIVDSISDIGIKIGSLLLIVGIADLFYQWWEFEKSIRMSKQEIKEEYKQTEGDPQIKAKIRSKQRQIARARMMEKIP
ncbi:MAG: EscU/YscU/HrcU family type III secretion system export apparatus switch protein, partial [Firmicutes bacterium]|nr:EscU/YscU/HrcU family type III secretion system export apparatus switch protein [Bacillota bacterium]